MRVSVTRQSAPIKLTPDQAVSVALKSAPGLVAPPNVLSVGNVTMGAPGSAASVAIRGTSPAQILDFSLPTPPSAETATPTVVGDTGSVGTSSNYARGDHVHPLPSYLTAANLAKIYGGLPSGVTPSLTSNSLGSTVAQANQSAFQAYFDSCRSRGWCVIDGGGQTFELVDGFGTNDQLATDTVDGMTLVLKNIKFWANITTAAYAKGFIRLAGNNVRVICEGNVEIDRPFQPVNYIGNLPGQRTAQGEMWGIVVGGPNRAGLVIGNYRSNAQVLVPGRLRIANMGQGVVGWCVTEGLVVQGDILVEDYLSTAYIPMWCGDVGRWQGLKARRGGDDCFFAYHPHYIDYNATPRVQSPFVAAGGQPDCSVGLLDWDFSTCLGKAWGFGGHSNVKVANGKAKDNWYAGSSIAASDGSSPSQWAPTNGVVKLSNIIYERPSNVSFPTAYATKYQSANILDTYGSGAFIWNEAVHDPSISAGKLTIHDVTVRNPSVGAVALTNIQDVDINNLICEAGSTTHNVPAGSGGTPTARVTSGAAVYLNNCTHVNSEVALIRGGNGEKFTHGHYVTGASTQDINIQAGRDDKFSVKRIYVDSAVPVGQVKASGPVTSAVSDAAFGLTPDVTYLTIDNAASRTIQLVADIGRIFIMTNGPSLYASAAFAWNGAGYGAIVLIDGGANFTTTLGTAGKINLSVDGNGLLTIQNNNGAQQVFCVGTLGGRTRFSY